MAPIVKKFVGPVPTQAHPEKPFLIYGVVEKLKNI